MISAVPCIATLLELHDVPLSEEEGNEGVEGVEGAEKPLATGQILLQNDLSLAYWGKLSSKDASGMKSVEAGHTLLVCALAHLQHSLTVRMK